MDRPGPPALVVMRELAFGGAERLASGILADIGAEGRDVILAVCNPPPREGDAAAWFPHPIRRVRIPSRPPALTMALTRLALSTGAGSLTLFGRSLAYRALPRLRRSVPSLRISAFQFNAEELMVEHCLYNPFIDTLIVESAAVAGALADAGAPPRKIRVIPSGPDLSRFSRAHEDWPPVRHLARPRVGFVGRLDPIKGPLVFVRAAERLRAQGFAGGIVMAGDGPAAAQTDAALARAGLAGHLTRLGRVDVDDVPALHASLDILVVPSLLDGRPQVIREAQVSGAAVIATRVGAIPDLIEDGATGRLVPPGDPEALARAILALAADPAERLRLAEDGRAAALHEGGLAAVLPAYRAAMLA